ncbi:MAG: hypothetical protein QME05_05675 [Candidatus Margulisbacteria bacterium]|nr:hypothetical protein [Candidatus Margulisiibacteriota bacterium]
MAQSTALADIVRELTQVIEAVEKDFGKEAVALCAFFAADKAFEEGGRDAGEKIVKALQNQKLISRPVATEISQFLKDQAKAAREAQKAARAAAPKPIIAVADPVDGLTTRLEAVPGSDFQQLLIDGAKLCAKNGPVVIDSRYPSSRFLF